MLTFLAFLCGLLLGGVVVGCLTTKPLDREVIEVGLKKILQTDVFVPIEWIYFQMELSAKDLPTLREVLVEYTTKKVVKSLQRDRVCLYRLNEDT